MLIQQLQEIAGRTAKLPRLLASWQIQTAAACGLVRPTILLPAGEIERRTPVAYAPGSDGAETNIGRSSAIRALLAHELAHIRRGDLWLLAVSRVLLIPLFVHPLYWLARRRIRADQELIADALAANNCGRHAYAENLLHWARHQPARLQRLAGRWAFRRGQVSYQRGLSCCLMNGIG